MYEYRFQVLGVYDGDTIKGVLDLGVSTFIGHPEKSKSWQSLRLSGINTPEKRGASYEDGILVRDYLRSLLPLGTWVTIRTELDKSGGFGRLLATIISEDGLDLNQILLEKGYAIEYKPSTPHPGLTESQRTEIRTWLENPDASQEKAAEEP